MAVRLCFGAVAAWWLAEAFLLGAGAGEPYPSVLMPRFASTAGYHDGAVHMQRMEAAFVGAGTETVVSRRALFEPYPDSHHAAFAGVLGPAPAPSSRVREWLRRTLLPGLRPPRGAIGGCVDPGLQRWLRQRAGEMGVRGPVTRVELRWYDETVHRSSRTSARRRPAGRVVVPLGEAHACAR